jgi:DnaJ domain
MFFGGDPFDHFHQHGGSGRAGSGRMPRRASSNVDTVKLYECLGVEKTAEHTVIKKAYRKLAVKVR